MANIKLYRASEGQQRSHRPTRADGPFLARLNRVSATLQRAYPVWAEQSSCLAVVRRPLSLGVRSRP